MKHPDTYTLVQFVDGLLAENDAAEVKRHISDCPVCMELAEQERALSSALRGIPLVSPSPQFDRRVLESVAPAAARRRRDRLAIRRYAGLLALCVVTLFVFVLAGQQQSDNPSMLRPVFDSVREWVNPLTDRVSGIMHDAVAPVREHKVRDSAVLEVLALALLGLGALGVLDRLLSSHLRKSRVR